MPAKEYYPPSLLFNAHLETIYPALFRKVKSPPSVTERIITPDDDFLDLEWFRQGSDKLVIISHGLEGNSSRAYVRGMAKAFYDKGFDALGWNYRGCGTEMNKQVRFYHSGATDDLDTIVRHAAVKYKELYLVGFSLGGNITLKYLGEQGQRVLPSIRKAVTFSVPLNLDTSCTQICKTQNWLYMQRFLRSLKKKVKSKGSVMQTINLDGIDRIDNLRDFDDRYTAPLHGFTNAVDYYQKCGAISFITNIQIPTLIVNALNDPFLSPECYPVDLLKGHPQVSLETPERGGHVGFSVFNKNGLYWSELRAVQFIVP